MRTTLAILTLALLVAAPARAYIVSWPHAPEVREVIRASRHEVARCVAYHETDARVRVRLELEVARDGQVRRVRFEPRGPLSPGTRYCVGRVFRAVRLPPPGQPSRLPVEYVFIRAR